MASSSTKENVKGGTSSVRTKKATHFGKANPKRDAFLFFAFVTFMFLVSYLFQETGLPSNTVVPKLPSLADIRQVQRVLEHSFEQGQQTGFEPDPECSLLLGQSSIPRAGWGIFASKHFASGEEILVDWPLTLEDIELGLEVLDQSRTNDIHATTKFLKLPTFALLLKPHSILSNVAWMYDDSGNPPKLVTTKSINIGDEIFLQWSDHLHGTFPGLFRTLPTVEQFRRADAIIQDTQEVYKNLGDSVPKRRVPDINKGLQVLHKALHRYDRNVASLLPLTVNDLLLYQNKTSTSELKALKRPPLSSLLRSTRCLSNIQWKRKRFDGQDGDSGQDKPLAEPVLSREYVEEGELIMPVPLLLHKTENGNLGNSEPRVKYSAEFCEYTGESITSLLPTPTSKSFCSRLSSFEGNELGYSLCPLYGRVEVTSNPQQANARYQWSARSDQHKQFLNDLRNASSWKEFPSRDATEKNVLTMSWDLVATRDIERGEVVRVLAETEREQNGQLNDGQTIAE